MKIKRLILGVVATFVTTVAFENSVFAQRNISEELGNALNLNSRRN